MPRAKAVLRISDRTGRRPYINTNLVRDTREFYTPGEKHGGISLALLEPLTGSHLFVSGREPHGGFSFEDKQCVG